MAFINFPNPTPIFPTLAPLAWPVVKKPSFKSIVSIGTTGIETQFIRAVFPRWEFKLTYGGDNNWLRDQTQNITPDPQRIGQTEFEQISGLFLQCLGSYGEFYYSDPSDCQRSNITIGKGDGATTTFLIYYSWGTGPYTPSFSAPVSGIASLDAVYLNGVLQSSSTYSMDSSNTMIVFNTPPGSGVTISLNFHFYFRCRFLADLQEYEQWAENLWKYSEVKFQSVKP
jgi:uncharacterized protein (TIGR02217 family)